MPVVDPSALVVDPPPAPAVERRSSARRTDGLWARLLTLDGEGMIHCQADDLGEGGLHLTPPVGFGFAVGQRYEVLLGGEGPDGEPTNLTGEGHYATVVRTEFLPDAQNQRGHLGVGLRFDQPLVL
ncbi:MAG: hypothetical protein IID40_09100 [Planctomycetes bacterium]|nr:hypothetical protein [Planctomycetota bacterium]